MGLYDDDAGFQQYLKDNGIKLDAEPTAPKNGGIIGDTVTGLKRGIEQIPGVATGLADIPANAVGINRPFSRAADWLGEKTGFQPGKWAEEARADYSPQLQESMQNVQNAKGFWNSVGAYIENPRATANLVAESLPSTLASGGIGRGVMAGVMGAEKLAATRAGLASTNAVVRADSRTALLKSGAVAGGIGEGTYATGQAMSQLGYDIDPQMAAATSLAAGIGTGVIGRFSGSIARTMGIEDLESSIAAGVMRNAGTKGAAGYAKSIAKGAFTEGALEELPQSMQEQVWQNVANGKDWHEGVSEAGAAGLVAGAAMGAGVNAIPRSAPKAENKPLSDENQPTSLLGHNPEIGTSWNNTYNYTPIIAEGGESQVPLERLDMLQGRRDVTEAQDMMHSDMSDKTADERYGMPSFDVNDQSLPDPTDPGSAIAVLQVLSHAAQNGQAIIEGSRAHEVLLEAQKLLSENGLSYIAQRAPEVAPKSGTTIVAETPAAPAAPKSQMSRNLDTSIAEHIAAGTLAADSPIVQEWNASKKQAKDATAVGKKLAAHLSSVAEPVAPETTAPAVTNSNPVPAATQEVAPVKLQAKDLTAKQRPLYDYMQTAIDTDNIGELVDAQGVFKYAEIGDKLGIARGSAKSFVNQIAKQIAKKNGVSVETMKEMLKARVAAIRTTESHDDDRLGLSPEQQAQVANEADYLGGEGGAEQSMGLISSVGGSQGATDGVMSGQEKLLHQAYTLRLRGVPLPSNNELVAIVRHADKTKNDIQPDAVQTAAENAFAQRRAEQARAEADAAFDAVMAHPEAKNAAVDFADTFETNWDSLTKPEQAEFVLSYMHAISEYDTFAEAEAALKKEFSHYGRTTEEHGSAGVQDSSGATSQPRLEGVRGASTDSEGIGSSGTGSGSKSTTISTKKRRVVQREEVTPTGVSSNNENPDTKYNLQTKLRKADFITAQEAAEWLSNNAKNPAFRLVANKISSYLGHTTLSFAESMADVPNYAQGIFSRGGLGVAARYQNGSVEVTIAGWKPNAATEENLLHELVHAATMGRVNGNGAAVRQFSDLAAVVKRELGTWNGTWPITDEKQKTVTEFFKSGKIFGDVDEFIAYVFSSPSMQDVMRLMAADGQWYKSHRSPGEITALNKNAGFQKQSRIPVPEYSLWHKFVDMVRALFGIPKVYNNQIATIVAQNSAIDENNRKASTVHFHTLKEKVDSLLDQLLSEKDVAQAEAPATVKYNVGETAGGGVQTAGVPGRNGASRLTSPTMRKTSGLVKQLMEVASDKSKSVQYALMFGHQFSELAEKIIPGAKQYFASLNEKQRERVKQEEAIASIATNHYALKQSEQNTVNRMIDRATSQEAWPFKPEWVPDAKVDAQLGSEFNAMSPESQQVVKDVFKFGSEQQKRFDESINDLMPEGQKINRKQMMGVPYAPLKRFGDHVVIGKSAAFMKEESDLAAQGLPTSAKLDTMKSDPAHYHVEFVDGDFEAVTRRDALAEANPTMAWDKKPLQVEHRDLNAMSFTMLERLKNSISDVDKTQGATKAALEALANQLYVAQLNHLHANKSQQTRKGVKGYETDMMRAFVSQGRSEASLIASLKTHSATEASLQKVKTAARQGGQQDNKTRIANEILRRHVAMLNYKETPIQNKLMATNSLYFLLTSPAYYLTNATQPFVLSLPVMTATHGSKAWGAMTGAYKQAFDAIKLFKNTNLDETALKTFDSVGNESGAIKALLDENLVNIGMEMELGDIVDSGGGKVTKAFKGGMKFMRTTVANVETLNRLSTAVAAYRLAYTEALNQGKSKDEAHTAGTLYARDVIIKTHGDYAGYNAPSIMMQGAYGTLPVKVLMQFKKFQFIQAGLLIGAFKQSINGATPEEKAVARKTLAYVLGTQMALAGSLGIPLMGTAAAALAAMGADDGEDKEAYLRRLIGNKTIAQLLLHGAPAAAGVDISKRIGMGNVFTPLPFVDDSGTNKDKAKNLIVGVAGPSASLFLRSAQGVDQMQKGQYWKGMESLLPNGAVTNLSKVARFESQGVTNNRGDVVMKPEEVGFFDDVTQALGLPSTTLTDRSWKASVDYDRKKHLAGEADALKRDYIEARKSGGNTSEITQKWNKLQAERVKQGFTRQSMSNLVGAPNEQMKRERHTINGIPYGTSDKKFVQNLDAL